MLFNVPSALALPEADTHSEGGECLLSLGALACAVRLDHFSHLWGMGLMVTVQDCLGWRAVQSNYWCLWLDPCVYLYEQDELK